MPDPTPVAPAPAAAAPTSTPTPPPAPTPAPAEAPPKSNSTIAKSLVDLLTAKQPGLTDAPKPKEEPKPKADAPPPEPKPGKQTVVKKKVETVPPKETPPPVPKRGQPAAPAPTPPQAAAPAPTPAPVAQSDEDFEKSLLDEERAGLDDAREAEKRMGKKYEGQATKQLAFLRENATKAAAVEKGEIDEADYRKWYAANAPKISPLDLRSIERARAVEDARKELEPRIAEESHARWVESETPRVRQKADVLYNKLATSALPDEVTSALAERTRGITDRAEYLKAVEEVKAQHSLEFEVAETVIAQATADLEEFHRLLTINPATNKPIKARNRDLSTEEGQWHAKIASMAHELCDDFKVTGGDALKRDGRWFATWREYAEIPDEQKPQWWTFTNDELADRAVGKVKGVISAEVKRRNDYLAARGYTRVRSSAPAAPAPGPAPAGAPPAPRATPPAASNQPPPTTGSRLANLLG